MEKIANELKGINTVAIAGHVRPDGDCVGSCMGLYLYLKEIIRILQQMYIWNSRERSFPFCPVLRKSKRFIRQERCMIC